MITSNHIYTGSTSLTWNTDLSSSNIDYTFIIPTKKEVKSIKKEFLFNVDDLDLEEVK